MPIVLGAIFVTAPPATGGDVSDAEALAITRKHCVSCHALKPTDESFQEAPNNVTLETIVDLKTYAPRIYVQTVQNRAMPLGNRNGMTEDERDALGHWLKALK